VTHPLLTRQDDRYLFRRPATGRLIQLGDILFTGRRGPARQSGWYLRIFPRTWGLWSPGRLVSAASSGFFRAEVLSYPRFRIHILIASSTEGRDAAMASPGRESAAEAGPDSAGRADAVARELIAGLARRRAASGLSQAHIARLMHTSQPAIARLESGRHDVAFKTLARYAGALGVSLGVVEDAETPGGDSAGSPGPDADAGPEGRPGTSAVITQMSDRRDPGTVLTWRQRKVLQAIRDFVQKRGYPPSMREIGEAVGLASTSSVAFQLENLQRKGYLHRRPRIVEVRLPGDTAAWPELRLEEGETAEMPGIDVFRLPGELIGGGTLCLIKVVGDSMTGAGITDGDWAVVRQQSSAQGGGLRDGYLVAAEIDGVPTVRTYRHSDGHISLSSHNPAYMPTVDDEKVSILGRVIAVLRGDSPAALIPLPGRNSARCGAHTGHSGGRGPSGWRQHRPLTRGTCAPPPGRAPVRHGPRTSGGDLIYVGLDLAVPDWAAGLPGPSAAAIRRDATSSS